MILSFLLVSGITVATMTVAYFTRALPRERYNRLDNSIVDGISNTKIGAVFGGIASATGHILELFTTLFGRKESTAARGTDSSNEHLDQDEYDERKRSAMESFMLSLSDQQLFTGIAVVASAFSKRCQISYISFAIATQLAWCSCITHLATLASLRTYLDKNNRTKRLRISLVAIMFLFLLGMVVYLKSGIPALPFDKTLLQCATHEVTLTLLQNSLSLAVSNFVGFRELVPKWRVSVFDEHGISKNAPRIVRQYWGEETPYRRTLSEASKTRLHFLLMVNQYSNSMWSELVVIVMTFAYQTFAIVWLGLVHHKSEWGFGQIMPIVLIALPLVSALEGYWGKWNRFLSCLATCCKVLLADILARMGYGATVRNRRR